MTTIAPIIEEHDANALVSARGHVGGGSQIHRQPPIISVPWKEEACHHEDGEPAGAPPTKGASPTVQLRFGSYRPGCRRSWRYLMEDDYSNSLDGGEPEFVSP